MTRHRLRPVRRWAWPLLLTASLGIAGVGIGSTLQSGDTPTVAVAPPTTPDEVTPSATRTTPTLAATPTSAAPSAATVRPRSTSPSAPVTTSTGTVRHTRSPLPKPTRPSPPKPKPTRTPRPRPTLPVTTPPTLKPSLTAQAQTLLNAERAKVGSGPVARYPGMDATAQDWAEHMRSTGVMEHRPQLDPYYGEIIAKGYTSAQSVIDAWLASPPHHKIMLDPSYDKVGIGYDDGYWIMVFS